MKVQLSIGRNTYPIETAINYDLHYSDVIATAENKILQNLLGPLCDNASVLDIGAGTGLVADITEPSLYAATDISDDMLKVLTSKHPESFTACADLQTQSGINSFIEQVKVLAPFDVVTSVFAAHFMGSNQVTLLKALRDLLNPGGTLVWHGNWPARKRRAPGAGSRTVFEDLCINFDHRTSKQMVKEAGFVGIDVHRLNAFPDILANRVPNRSLRALIAGSKVIPSRLHYHGAIIAKKPLGAL